MYYKYDEIELGFLKSKDKKLKEAIERIGIIKREINPNLFSALVNTIIGQQISTKAHITIWNRLKELTEITPESLVNIEFEKLQNIGISNRKTTYIKDVSQKIYDKEFDIEGLITKSDDEVINELIKLKGIGIWSAEMLMIFSMNRKDVLSYGDLAIIRGLKKLYNHKEISKDLFNKYKKRYSPYGSIASLYLWKISSED